MLSNNELSTHIHYKGNGFCSPSQALLFTQFAPIHCTPSHTEMPSNNIERDAIKNLESVLNGSVQCFTQPEDLLSISNPPDLLCRLEAWSDASDSEGNSALYKSLLSELEVYNEKQAYRIQHHLPPEQGNLTSMPLKVTRKEGSYSGCSEWKLDAIHQMTLSRMEAVFLILLHPFQQ